MDSSTKVDTTMELVVDDASPDSGGSRRPGNLWTVEAREDMFRRREAGETWETICQDYPKRSRHAMQQQYSMMKKQRALANGTWTSNRRGRKRKNLSPERWTPANRNGNLDGHDEDLTEADELSDADPDVGEESATRDVVPRLPPLAEDGINGRPNPLARSITDPPPRTARPRAGPNSLRHYTGPTPAPDAPPRPSPSTKVQGNLGEVSPIGGIASGKRRKVSPERAAEGGLPSALPPSGDANSSNFVLPSVVFDHSEFLAFLQKGIDQAQVAAKGFDMEKAVLKQNFEASISRANRRVHDAQERLRWAQYESGEKFKARDRELNEKLKARQRDHAEEKENMRKEFDREKKHVEEIQVKNIEALTRQNELLCRDMEHQRKQMDVQSQEYERELSMLRSEQPKGRTTKIQDIVDSPTTLSGDKQIKQDSDEQTRSPKNGSAEPLPIWKTLRQSQLDTFQKLVGGIEELSSSIERLNKELDSSSMKRVSSDIHRLDEEGSLLVRSKDKAAQALKAFHSEVEPLFNKLSVESPNGRASHDPPLALNGT